MAAPGAGRGLTRGLSGLPRGAISRKVNPAMLQTVENSMDSVYNSDFGSPALGAISRKSKPCDAANR